MKQLGGIDASFLYMETRETPMHVGGLSLFELPPGYAGDFYEDFKAHMGRRMHLAPILGKKLAPMPFELDHPVWVDEHDIDLEYHIRRLTVPRPGTMEKLEDLVGRLHSNFLDRSRPLWEYYVIDGLASGHVALYSKVHHAAIDGGAGVVLTKVLYDVTPVPREVEPPPERPRAGRNQLDLVNMLGTAYTNMLRQQIRTLQAIPDVLKTVANLTLPKPDSLKLDLASLPQLLAPRTILNGTITSQRAFAARSVPIGEVKRIAKLTDSKLNDVVMAMCSGALRRYLEEKNGLPQESLTAFVPVSLREKGNTDLNNQVFGMLCSLATHVAKPIERLKAILQSSQQAKQLTMSIKDAAVRDYSLLWAPLLLQGLIGLYGSSKLADQLPPSANVTISNVPGPNVPLYMAGAKLVTLYPVSIPAHGVGLNITVQSYCGTLEFGLTACRKTVPDVARLADYIVEELQLLKAAVGHDTEGLDTKERTR